MPRSSRRGRGSGSGATVRRRRFGFLAKVARASSVDPFADDDLEELRRHRLGGGAVEDAGVRDDAAEAGDRIGGPRRLERVRGAARARDAARDPVLDDRQRASREEARGEEGRVRVEEVRVGELLPLVEDELRRAPTAGAAGSR